MARISVLLWDVQCTHKWADAEARREAVARVEASFIVWCDGEGGLEVRS